MSGQQRGVNFFCRQHVKWSKAEQEKMGAATDLNNTSERKENRE
jgi:hypothetical protein